MQKGLTLQGAFVNVKLSITHMVQLSHNAQVYGECKAMAKSK